MPTLFNTFEIMKKTNIIFKQEMHFYEILTINFIIYFVSRAKYLNEII